MTNKNILIIGASGQISQQLVQLLLEQTTDNLTLFLRNANKLPSTQINHPRVSVIEGDATNQNHIEDALTNIDIVFASLAGEIDQQAQVIVTSMQHQQVERLIFVTALGIYDEVPGEFGFWNDKNIGAYLPPYRKAADFIEASSLNYTILRPAWLTNNDEIDYETTPKGEPFKGTEVSRKSVAALGAAIIENPELYKYANIGVNKPNTDGVKPSWL